MVVRTGLDQFADHAIAALKGKRLGIVTHPAAITCSLQHISDLPQLHESVFVTAWFGPEHGYRGDAQDLVPVAEEATAVNRPRVYSLYGDCLESLRPSREQLRGLDALVIDMQDVGSRYYTFQTTMLFCLEAAAEVQLPVYILDRPNPIGGLSIEGPGIDPGFTSFVGWHSIPIRHGMTMGELARLYQVERNLDLSLEVIACAGWQRKMYHDATGLPWVLPSPNMPTLDTAIVYPGQCLFEGTNLSEGRGTTRPFEICGAPWIDPVALVERMRSYAFPGVALRPLYFRPMFHKHAGQLCGGVQIHVTDRQLFRPVRVSTALLLEMRLQDPGRFRWRTEPYEFVADRLAIDLLFGSPRERLAIEAGEPFESIQAAWASEEIAFHQRRSAFLIY